MRSRMSPHDQAKLGAATGGVLMLWVGFGAAMILIPLGIALVVKAAMIAGVSLIATGVLLLGFVVLRHVMILRHDNSEETFFPD